jgi:hypothetical protein
MVLHRVVVNPRWRIDPARTHTPHMTTVPAPLAQETTLSRSFVPAVAIATGLSPQDAARAVDMSGWKRFAEHRDRTHPHSPHRCRRRHLDGRDQRIDSPRRDVNACAILASVQPSTFASHVHEDPVVHLRSSKRRTSDVANLASQSDGHPADSARKIRPSSSVSSAMTDAGLMAHRGIRGPEV